ncbi:MAG: hypothetical protein RR609_06685 [Aurantimicrobium sp.]
MPTLDLRITTEDSNGERDYKSIPIHTGETINNALEEIINSLYWHKFMLKPYNIDNKLLDLQIVMRPTFSFDEKGEENG